MQANYGKNQTEEDEIVKPPCLIIVVTRLHSVPGGKWDEFKSDWIKPDKPEDSLILDNDCMFFGDLGEILPQAQGYFFLLKGVEKCLFV